MSRHPKPQEPAMHPFAKKKAGKSKPAGKSEKADKSKGFVPFMAKGASSKTKPYGKK